jgi:hypothetical protein
MQPKIILCLALVLIGGLSASGRSAEFPITPKNLDQGRFVFSISTSPAQEGIAFHVTITAKTGIMPSDAHASLSIVTSTQSARSIGPVKPELQVTLQKEDRIWTADFVASIDLLKNPDVCLVFNVPAHDDKGVPMPAVDFYEIKLRDFLAAADVPEQEGGLACTLIVPTPYRIHWGQLGIQVVLKNVSAAPIRVCTLCGMWRGESNNWSEVSLDAGFFKSAGPGPDELAKAVVSIPPGASLTLSSNCDIPETTPFRLTARYITAPDMAKSLNTWQGGIQAEPVMIDIKPREPSGNSDEVVASFREMPAFPDQPAYGQETAAKVFALLRDNHIEAVGVGNAGSTSVNVPRKDAQKARELIAQAIKTGKLDVELAPEGEEVPSPDKNLSVVYQFPGWADFGSNLRATISKVVGNMGSTPWTFTAQGEAMEFSWSPDAHYLLFGVVRQDHGMTLDVVDTRATPIKERDLNLADIEKQVMLQLPLRPVGVFAHYSQIDFDHVEWTSPTHCRLHYGYEDDRQAGDAILDLDLAAPSPELKLVQVTRRKS